MKRINPKTGKEFKFGDKGKHNHYSISDNGDNFIFEEVNYIDGFIDYNSTYDENGNLIGRTEYDYKENIKVYYDENGEPLKGLGGDLEEWEKFPVQSKEYELGIQKLSDEILDSLEKRKNKESK